MNCGTCTECKIKSWVFENVGFLKFSKIFRKCSFVSKVFWLFCQVNEPVGTEAPFKKHCFSHPEIFGGHGTNRFSDRQRFNEDISSPRSPEEEKSIFGFVRNCALPSKLSIQRILCGLFCASDTISIIPHMKVVAFVSVCYIQMADTSRCYV